MNILVRMKKFLLSYLNNFNICQLQDLLHLSIYIQSSYRNMAWRSYFIFRPSRDRRGDETPANCSCQSRSRELSSNLKNIFYRIFPVSNPSNVAANNLCQRHEQLLLILILPMDGKDTPSHFPVPNVFLGDSE